MEMEISESGIMSLNNENSNDFILKKDKENSLKENLEIDVHVNAEDEQLLKLREIPRRKSSTGSTSTSKPEDPSEIFSLPSSPRNFCPQDGQQRGVFFGKDRNCSNPIFNFYQITEEHLRETFSEYKSYTKTKNYILKEEYYKQLSTLNENKNKIEENKTNNVYENKTVNNNTNNNNPINTPKMGQIKAIPAIIGAFTPNPFNYNKGKFDLPMYYCVGFYQWDCKYYLFKYFFYF